MGLYQPQILFKSRRFLVVTFGARHRPFRVVGSLPLVCCPAGLLADAKYSGSSFYGPLGREKVWEERRQNRIDGVWDRQHA